MSDAFLRHAHATLDEIEAAGLFKRERLIAGRQGGRIQVASEGGERTMLNLCANNYLGLADHPEVIAAARSAMDAFGFGMASVRFICGTQTLHRELEHAIAKHLGKDDAIVFAQVPRDRELELAMQGLRAADETHRGHAEAEPVERRPRRRFDLGVIGEPEIVVGAEIDHLAAGDADAAALRPIYQPLALGQPVGFDGR